MKKTLTINLGGIVYHIDDDAYQALRKYLSVLESELKGSDDRKEILEDIEARISEILNDKISSTRKVVTLEDIQEVMAQMGDPNDISGAEKSEQHHQFTGRKKARRMYRDPDNRVLGGVCSGLGSYWQVEANLLRVLFVFLAIFGMAGVLIYIILWIVLPEAKSVAQKLEMRGEAVTFSSIRDFFKSEFEHVKGNFNKKR